MNTKTIATTLSQTQLQYTQLSRSSDPDHLPASTKRLKRGDIFLGQHRAKQAIEFAVNMPFNDFHLCAVGTTGLGKRQKITQYLQTWTRHHKNKHHTLYEYIYVHHFKQPNQPILLTLLHGKSTLFQQKLATLWLKIIPLLKSDIFVTPIAIQHQLADLFHHLEQESRYLFPPCSHTTFKQYLQDYLQHISHHVRDILAFLDNDYYLSADFILNSLPNEYRIYCIHHHNENHLPIVYESNPTLTQLFGVVSGLHNIHTPLAHGEYRSQHFDLQIGSLLKANGGFLLLDLKTLAQSSTVWALFKQCLKTKQFDWKNIQNFSANHQHILQLPPIPLNIKVILLCDSDEFDDMLALDGELSSLFKIRADFTDSITRTPEHELAFVQYIGDMIHQYDLLPCDRGALAEILTEFSRQAEDQNLLLLHDGLLHDILQESQHYALQNQMNIINAYHVQTALKQRHYRLGYWRDLYWQDLLQGTQMIDTQGVRLGQVNALSVIHFADTEFGFPSRLTASVSQGAGDILDIERSVELGGSLHAKGTLLMSSFLKSHFGRQQILNFSAALAFEQSYGEVDGDSATVAELCALISAISQIPIQQSWAITGSMNQLGQVQPVGGINAKIEGFFDACVLQGLTGEQGVIIPRLNIQHLMLRQDIIYAVKSGRFHIHAIDHVEHALELLMNRPVGRPDKKGFYPQNSIYEAVLLQLASWQDDDMIPEDTAKKKKKRKNNG